MPSSFLNIPVDFSSITKKAELRRININQSIHNMLHLILTTSYGEVKFDPSFGCEIWLHDFETIYNPQTFKEILKKSLLQSIRNNEKRLTNVSIDFQFEQKEIISKIKNKRFKTRIVILINGLIEETNEPFGHRETFFIGPLSYS
jgi:phage baseplate assembly protein W